MRPSHESHAHSSFVLGVRGPDFQSMPMTTDGGLEREGRGVVRGSADHRDRRRRSTHDTLQGTRNCGARTDAPSNPSDYTPEVSRRRRGVDAWAALRTLGRSGLGDLVEPCCRLANRFADAFAGAGFAVLNDVVLNQVLVSFGDAERTRQVIAAVQAGVDASIAAILRIARS